jgi:hypothetical protein
MRNKPTTLFLAMNIFLADTGIDLDYSDKVNPLEVCDDA